MNVRASIEVCGVSSETDIFGELSLKGCGHQHLQRQKCVCPEHRLSHKINSPGLVQTEMHFDKVREPSHSSGLRSLRHMRGLV